jgi:hypothetical protein
MHIMKATKPNVGSDEDMIRRGYHLSSKDEQEQHGKFVRKESVLSAVSGLIIQWAGKRREVNEPVDEFDSQTAGSTFQPDRQQQEQLHIRRNVVKLTAAFEPESGRWQTVRWVEPEWQH